jgi:hypothetical protein
VHARAYAHSNTRAWRVQVLELAEQLDALARLPGRDRLMDREMSARVRLSHVIDLTDATLVKVLGALYGHLQANRIGVELESEAVRARTQTGTPVVEPFLTFTLLILSIESCISRLSLVPHCMVLGMHTPDVVEARSPLVLVYMYSSVLYSPTCLRDCGGTGPSGGQLAPDVCARQALSALRGHVPLAPDFPAGGAPVDGQGVGRSGNGIALWDNERLQDKDWRKAGMPALP